MRQHFLVRQEPIHCWSNGIFVLCGKLVDNPVPVPGECPMDALPEFDPLRHCSKCYREAKVQEQSMPKVKLWIYAVAPGQELRTEVA